jgi:ABC-2 type transport system permease protein
MIRPQSGSIRILGIDPQKTLKAVHTQIGYLPGELNIEANLRVKSALRHFTELRGNNVEWDYAHQGYMDTYYFSYMTIILGIFAISACANLLVSDEEKGTLDLLMAYPVSRSGFFWGRFLGFLIATMSILLISWLGWLIPAGSSGLELSAIEMLRPFLPLFVVLVLFGALALLLSMLLPAARLASGLAGGLLIVNFLLIGLANINPDMMPIYELTPLHFYQGGAAIGGLDWGNLLGLAGIALLLTLLAWWRFQRREIRVGGEGGWKLPRLAILGKLS